MMRRFAAVLAISLLFTSSIREVSAADGTAAARSLQASLQEVSEGLTCQCGCGLTVANCNHPTCGFAVPIRLEIDKDISNGMDRAAIVAAFRHKYGEKVLSAPTTEGFNILAWLMPFIALLAGVGGVVIAVSRWNARSAQKTPSLAAVKPAADDARLRQELEREVARNL